MASNTHKISFVATSCKPVEIERFARVLSALGMDAEIDRATDGVLPKNEWRVTVRGIPDPDQAKRMRTRNAGRKGRGIEPPVGSPFTPDTPVIDFLRWREEHTATECMEALGLSQATYYRKLQIMESKPLKGFVLRDVY